MATAPPLVPLDPVEAALQSIGGASALPASTLDPRRRPQPEEDQVLRQFEQAVPDRPAQGHEEPILQRFEGTPVRNQNRPARPAEDTVLKEFEQTAPPPAVIEEPTLPAVMPGEPPAAPAQAPVQRPVARNGKPMPPPHLDPVTGHVLDPVTGKPMQRGQPVAAPPAPGFDWGTFGRGVAGTIGGILTEPGKAAAGGYAPETPGPPSLDIGGHVIDPVTGKPMVRGQAHDVSLQGFVGQTAEAVTPVLQTVQTYVTNPVARVAAVVFNPLAAWVKSGLGQMGREYEADPARANLVAGFLRGTISEAGLKAAWQGFISPDIQTTGAFSGPGIRQIPLFGMKIGSPEDEATRGILNFIADIPVGMLADLVATKGALPKIARALSALDRVTEARGLQDLKIPIPEMAGGPRSVRDLRAAAADNRELAHMIGAAQGRSGPALREALTAKVQAARDMAELQKAGAPLWRVTPDGRRVNQVDELAYHWIEAGADEGSKYQNRDQAIAVAHALTPDAALGNRIAGWVERTGTAYAKVWEQTGRRLEAAGFLKPGTVDAMGDRYAARMYQSTSHNPDDIEAWTQAAQEINAATGGQYGLSERAIQLGQQVLGRPGESGSMANAAKSRKIMDFGEREARGGEFQATPIFAKSVPKSARIAERQEVLKSVAESRLAQPGSESVPQPPREKPVPDAADVAWQQHLAAQKAAASGKTPAARSAPETAAVGPESPQAAGEVPAAPVARYTPEDLDQAKADVAARGAEHQQAIADLEAATTARQSAPAGPVTPPAPASPVTAPVPPPEVQQLRDTVEAAKSRLQSAQAAARTDRSPAATAAVADAQFHLRSVRGLAAEMEKNWRLSLPRAGEIPEAGAVRVARQGVQDAMREAAAARKAVKAGPTEENQAALAEAQAKVKDARGQFETAATEYRRGKLPKGSLQERYAGQQQQRVSEAQTALDQAIDQHLVAQQGADPAAAAAAQKAVDRAAQGLKQAKRAYRDGLDLTDAGIQRRYDEAVRDSAIRWANAQNAQARIERGIAAGPPTVKQPLAVPPGSRLLTGRQYGAADGLIVPAHVKQALDAYLAPARPQGSLDRLVQEGARRYKQQALFLNVPSLLHKAKYDTVLATGALADAGVKANPATLSRMLAKALQEDKAWRATGKMSPAVDALDKNTRALVDTHAQADLGEMGSSLRNALAEKPPNMAMATYRWLRDSVPKGIGNIERVYKIMLTEQLAGKYGYPEAARIAQETISGAHTVTPIYQVIDRYGGIPFMTARLRALPRMLKQAVTSPGLMRQASGIPLAAAMTAAMPPDVQERQKMLGPEAIPIPGLRDAQGQQRFLTKNPLSVNPTLDIRSLGGGVGGALGAAGEALANVDLPHTLSSKQAQSITQPGEMPPMDADWERFMYALQRVSPSIGRSAERLQMAREGRTQFGGPYQEPESLTDALLGITTGARLGVAETAAEKKSRALQMMGPAMRAVQYAAGYYNSLASGQEKVPAGLASQAEQYTDLSKARGVLALAKERLKSIADGNQYKGQAQTDALKRQTAWVYVLLQHFTQLMGQQQQLERQARAAGR